MRTFVILLVLANLAYLGWNLTRPPEQPVRDERGNPAATGAATLRLLDEAGADNTPAAAEQTTREPPSCIALGTFNNTDESDFLVSALQERGMQARVELLQAGDAVRYRVYMPPFNSDTAARQTLGALQGDGFDSFRITSGDLSGGISLGVFSQESLALNQQERLAAQGYATSIQEIVSATNEIWVTIEGLSQDLLEGTNLLDLLTDGLELDVIEKPCETIASGA